MKWIIKLSIILTLSYSKIVACAGGWSELYVQDEYYNFLEGSMIGIDEKNPLYKLSASYSAHDERFNYFEQQKKEENLKAWQGYFNNKRSLKEIEALFYTKNSIEKSYQEYKKDKKYPSFTTYLGFLSMQNGYAQNQLDDTKEIFSEVAKQGMLLLKEEKDSFLRERYLYLMMRLYHHQEKYEKVLTLYKDYVQDIKSNSIVKEWIDALLAGSYQHLNLNLKANQLYAKIFKEHKTNAHLGYYDFKISSDREWKTLLAEAPDNDTKALYHFLRAMQWKNEPLLEFESIAQIAPKSVWFERLSYMIMQDLQNQRYQLMSQANNKDKYFTNSLKSYDLQKNRFLKILAELKEPSFFTLYSKLYLNMLENKTLQDEEVTQLNTLANEHEKPYVALLSYLNSLNQLHTNSLSEQETLYAELKTLLPQLKKEEQQKSILRYTALQVGTLYPKESIETHFHELFAKNKKIDRLDIFHSINYESSIAFEEYIKNEKRSFLEKEVFKSSMKSLYRNDVAKILTTLFMQDNNFTMVKFYLRQIPKANVDTPYNPFNVTLSGNNRTLSHKSYNQREFSETMLQLEYQLKTKPQSAMDHFLYANGLYNKSWFGNFPMSSVLYRNTTIDIDSPLPKTTNLDEAKKHYELAYQYTEDKEFKAKIAYQLLKIAFNKALINRKNYDKDTWSMPVIGLEYNGTDKVIQLLKASTDFNQAIKNYKSEHGDTNYGEKIIKSCITFRYF